MKRLPVLILAAGAALAAPAFAETLTYYSWDPVAQRYVEHTTIYEPVPTVSRTYIEIEPLPVTTYSYVEPLPATYIGPDIVVTAPRGSVDELITYDVVDRIAADPRIQGKVGVETYRRNVTLTGKVTSPVQVERVERDAKSVEGVREVTNLVRARVGG